MEYINIVSEYSWMKDNNHREVPILLLTHTHYYTNHKQQKIFLSSN